MSYIIEKEIEKIPFKRQIDKLHWLDGIFDTRGFIAPPFDSFEQALTDALKKASYISTVNFDKEKGAVTIKVKLPGYDKSDIKSLDYNATQRRLYGVIENKEFGATTINEIIPKVEPSTIVVKSFDKGILVIEASTTKKENDITRIV